MNQSIIEKYNQYEFDNIIVLLANRIDQAHIRKVYQLKLINERKNVFNRIENYIKAERHLCLSLMRRDEPFSFTRFDDEGIVESVEKFYELYLVSSTSNVYYYCVVKINFFPSQGGLERELVLLQQVHPFAFRFYFRRKRLIYHGMTAEIGE